MTPAAARRAPDLDAAHRGLKLPGRWMTYPRDLARTVTRLARDGPPAASFSNCRPGSHCAMGAFGAGGAEARLPDSVHAAHPSRSKTAHGLEPRYGIEP